MSVWVRLLAQKWVVASQIVWSQDDDGWGVALIDGVWYHVLWSYDGDGYVQMADAEIGRYDRLHV